MRRVALVLALAVLPCAALAAETDPVVLMERGYLRQAEAAFAARIASRSDDAVALTRLSRIRVEQNRLDEAIALGEKAAAAAPRSADALYALAEACGAKAERAGVLKAAGLAGKFKKAAEAALALDPRHAEALEAMIEFHRQAPGLMGGDKKKIPALLDRLTEANPPAGWLMRGRAALRAKDTTEVERCYRRAASLEAGGSRARMALASWLGAPWRNPAEAEKLALAVAADEPWRQDAWALAAALQVRAGRYDDVDATLARAEAADPGRFGPCYLVARELINSGRELDRARVLLERYLAHEPEIGWPSHAGAHWRMGQLLEKRGDRAGARAEMELALKLDPELDQAKKDLKRLKG